MNMLQEIVKHVVHKAPLRITINGLSACVAGDNLVQHVASGSITLQQANIPEFIEYFYICLADCQGSFLREVIGFGWKDCERAEDMARLRGKLLHAHGDSRVERREWKWIRQFLSER